MIPYKIKHKATGLYYKPGKPQLSRIGKVYATGNNVLNAYGGDDIPITSNRISLTRQLEDLGYGAHYYGHNCEAIFSIPKSDFEIESLIDSVN